MFKDTNVHKIDIVCSIICVVLFYCYAVSKSPSFMKYKSHWMKMFTDDWGNSEVANFLFGQWSFKVTATVKGTFISKFS